MVSKNSPIIQENNVFDINTNEGERDNLLDYIGHLTCRVPFKEEAKESIRSYQMRGMISSNKIFSLFNSFFKFFNSENQKNNFWCAFFVRGFDDSIFGWEDFEKGFLFEGDNDYIIYFDNHSKKIRVYTLLGNHDSFNKL